MLQIIPDLVHINNNLSNICLGINKLNERSFFDSNTFSVIIGFLSALLVFFLDKTYLKIRHNKNKNKKIFINYIKKLELKEICYFIKEQDFSCVIYYKQITKLINLIYYKDKIDISYLKDKDLKLQIIALIDDLEEFEYLFTQNSENIENTYKVSSKDEQTKNDIILKLNNKRQPIFNKYKNIEKSFFKNY